MKIAVIGLGDIAAKAYLPVLGVREGVEIQLVSRSAETVRCFQNQYRIEQGTTDLAEVERWKPDGAFVLSPSPTHFEIVKYLLEAGIDVFVEKPATMHAAETRTLTELAASKECVFMVGFNRRYAPLHQQARARWGDRSIGFATFEKHRASTWHPRLDEHYVEDAIHQIDVLRYFCGDGRAVSTQVETRDGLVAVAISTVALERGGYAQVLTSTQAGGWQERYALHGDLASLTIDAFERVRFVTPEEELCWGETYASAWKTTLEARGFTGQIEHFLECVTERKEPNTSGREALKTQLLLEEMLAVVQV